MLFLHRYRGLSTHSAALSLAPMNVIGIGSRIGIGRWSDGLRARMAPLRAIGLASTVGTAAVALLVNAPLGVLVPTRAQDANGAGRSRGTSAIPPAAP